MRFQMRVAVLAAGVLAAVPEGAHAQRGAPGAALSLSAGARTYSPGGSALAVALRAEYPITPTFLLEAAGSVSDPVERMRAVTSVFEVQGQLQLPGGRIAPYFGVGAGLARFREFEIERTERSARALVSIGAGARIALRRELGLVADARFRGPDSDHVDLTVGLRYRFR